MTTIFKGTPKFTGMSRDHAHVAAIGGLVLIRSVDVMGEEAATIIMPPKQARALAQGIIEAADRAEGKQ